MRLVHFRDNNASDDGKADMPSALSRAVNWHYSAVRELREIQLLKLAFLYTLLVLGVLFFFINNYAFLNDYIGGALIAAP